MADKESNELNRREFLRKAAVTGAVAWAVPIVQSVAATPAYAQAAGTVCQHSIGPNSCMEACKSRGQAACGHDCGGGCATICNPACAQGTCPPQYCNPACFTVTDCSGSCDVTFTC
jgi:hypothetical protein